MLFKNEEVIDPQTKIVFSKMSDRSIFLEIPGELQLFNKSDFIECDQELNFSQFNKKEIIEAFERVEQFFYRKPSPINTALDGNGE